MKSWEDNILCLLGEILPLRKYIIFAICIKLSNVWIVDEMR